jgi:hypothetical protein
MITPENNNDEKDENKKFVYKETEGDEKEKDAGDSSSASDFGRTDFIKKPTRSNKPLGSGHEPGTL